MANNLDAKLLKLGAKFECAIDKYRRECAALDAARKHFTDAEFYARSMQLFASLDASRDAIAGTTAKTLEGFQVKARAAAWPYGVENGTEFPDLDDKVVNSIIADLLASAGSKARAEAIA